MHFSRHLRTAALAAFGILAACAGEPDVDDLVTDSSQDVVSLSKTTPAARDSALTKLKEKTGNEVLVSFHKATGSARCRSSAPRPSRASTTASGSRCSRS